MRPLEHLSRQQRKATPLPLCDHLVARVQAMFKVSKVAVLWTMDRGGNYFRLWPRIEMWGKRLDANLYEGPWPVICHPPCGPWGKYKAKSHESKADGIKAIEIAHRWGGVVEHPLGSLLFKEHGRKGAEIEVIDQSDFGHQARKQTILYWVKPEIATCT